MSSQPIKLLAVCSFLPYPVDRGDPQRVFHLLQGLIHLRVDGSRVFDVQVLSALRADSTPRDVTALCEALGTNVATGAASWPYATRRLGRAGSWMVGAVLGTPNWIVERSSRSLKSHVAALQSDVAILFGEAAGVYQRHLRPGTLVVWDKSNVLGASSKELWAGRPLRSRLAANAARRYERRVLSYIDRVAVTSDVEADRLEVLYGRKADAVLASPITPFPSVSWRPTKRIGWMGSLGYSANSDGLVRFLSEGWPSLGAQGFHLEVVGSGHAPPKLRKAIVESHNVSLRGFIDDLGTWMDGLHVAVIPLWSGAGVKLKTLHWLASGIPVVGTQVAFEGVPAHHGIHVMISNDANGLARVISTLTAEAPDRLSSMTRVAREMVLEQFDSLELAERYGSLLSDWCGR